MSLPPPPTSFVAIKPPNNVAKSTTSTNELGDLLSKRKEKEPEKFPKEVNWKVFHKTNENNKTLKIIVISDTHDKHDKLKIPNGDILICCGDITEKGTVEDVKKFNDFLSQIDQVKYKVVIAGNHDKELCKYSKEQIQKEVFTNAIYLQDSSVTIEGIKIYGTPFVPNMSDFPGERKEIMKKKDNRYYYRSETDLIDIYNKIDEDTDILISHTPPHGVLDGHYHYGSKSLMERLKLLKNLKVNTFGHVHMGYGFVKLDDVTFINAACDGDEQPIVFEYVL
ncbi:hypothetical protein ABK040_008212 [Willaertia magna]